MKTAHHDDKGIFIATGQGIKQGEKIEDVNIIDLTPTILAAYGIKPPNDMDGRVLDEIFQTPPQFVVDANDAESASLESDTGGYTPEEEKAIEERLRGLGYVD